MKKKKKEIIYIQSDSERTGWRIWRALGRSNKRRRVNAFILLLTVMVFIVSIVLIAGKYQLVKFLFGGQ